MLPGLHSYKNFISDEWEENLITFINTQPWNEKLSRRTQHYGYEYDYSKVKSPKKTMPIPKILEIVKNAIESLPEIRGSHFDQCIINEYLPGQGINSHIDHVRYFGPIITSLSLGSNCNFKFKYLDKEINYLLEKKELLIFTGDSRYLWKHEIPKTESDRSGTRYSITFRTVIF